MTSVPNVPCDRRPPARTAAEKRARDTEIAARAARGEKLVALAAEFGLSRKQIGRIVHRQRTWSGGDVIDPAAEVQATLDLLGQALADLAAIVRNPDNHAAAVGAARLAIETRLRRLEMLAQLGFVPRDLRQFRLADELQLILREQVDVLKRHGVLTDALLTDLAATIERMRPVARPVATLAAAA